MRTAEGQLSTTTNKKADARCEADKPADLKGYSKVETMKKVAVKLVDEMEDNVIAVQNQQQFIEANPARVSLSDQSQKAIVDDIKEIKKNSQGITQLTAREFNTQNHKEIIETLEKIAAQAKNYLGEIELANQDKELEAITQYHEDGKDSAQDHNGGQGNAGQRSGQTQPIENNLYDKEYELYVMGLKTTKEIEQIQDEIKGEFQKQIEVVKVSITQGSEYMNPICVCLRAVPNRVLCERLHFCRRVSLVKILAVQPMLNKVDFR